MEIVCCCLRNLGQKTFKFTSRLCLLSRRVGPRLTGIIFHETFLPVNMEVLLMAKKTTDVNNYLLLVRAVQEFSAS